MKMALYSTRFKLNQAYIVYNRKDALMSKVYLYGGDKDHFEIKKKADGETRMEQ